MPISVRLDHKTEAALRQRLREHGIPMSDFVRSAIQEKLDQPAPKNTPYELGREVFGRHSSGERTRSQRRKAIVKAQLDAKHRR
ncbi:MAG: hypothetical protein L0H15_07130 [Nitrosospira sp.]|nr:hypothetical protein [Nitrosospira sp.]